MPHTTLVASSWARANTPSAAVPTTSMPAWPSRARESRRRVTTESSTTSTRADATLPARLARPRPEGRQPGPAPAVAGGDDLAAEVDQAADLRRGERDAGHLVLADDLLDLDHVDADVVPVDEERAELAVGHRQTPAGTAACSTRPAMASTAGRS